MLYIGLLDIYLYMNKLFKFTPKFQFLLLFLLQGQGHHFVIINVGLLSSDNDQICHYFYMHVIIMHVNTYFK